jgi:glyoxylase-like metal-dependent hydrolase (beta-lactamase superfamily II)
MLDRRQIARTIGAVSLTALAGCASGLSGASPMQRGKTALELETLELAPDVTLIAGVGGNVLALRGPDCALLVDGGLPEHARGVVERATGETGTKKVAVLVNTHWHPDHTGANDLLGSKGARILAHENTKLWMGTEIRSRWQDKVYPPRPAKALPTETFYTTKDLIWGAERIQCGYLLQAHTDGDIYVFLRNANVMAAGGVVAGRGWPVIDWETGGWIGGMVRGIETLIAQADERTIVVPGDGPVLTRADLVKQRDMYVTIMGRLKTMMQSGFSADRVIAGAPAAEFEAERGDASQFLRLAFRSFWGHVRQFDVV